MNFPRCLCPRDFLLVLLLTEMDGRWKKLYLLTAQDTPLIFVKGGKWEEGKMSSRREEEENMIFIPPTFLFLA